MQGALKEPEGRGTGGNRDSGIYEAAISGDGQSLAYATYADNLVENDIYPEYERARVLLASLSNKTARPEN